MTFLQFISLNMRWLLGGFLLTFCSSFGQTFFISLFGKEIRIAYELTDGEFGGIYMLATLASALCLTQLGRIVDHLRVATVILIILPVLAAAALMMSLASTSVAFLCATIFLLRLFGQGMMTHTAFTAMGRWYKGYRGRAVSVVTIGHQAGEAVLPISMVVLAAGLGWQNSWALSAAFLLFVALPIIWLLLREERHPRANDAPEVLAAKRDWTRAEVLRDPLFWSLCIGVMAPPFIGTSIFFHQDYMVDFRGWPPESYAGSFVFMSVFTVTFAIIAGQLIDRFTAVSLLPFFLLPLSVACLFLSLVENLAGIYLFMGFLGVSYGISSTLFGALWPQIYGIGHLGSVRSIVVAMMVFLTALGPGVTGYFIDLGVAFPQQVFWMAVYCLLACAVMVVVAARLKTRLTSGAVAIRVS